MLRNEALTTLIMHAVKAMYPDDGGKQVLAAVAFECGINDEIVLRAGDTTTASVATTTRMVQPDPLAGGDDAE